MNSSRIGRSRTNNDGRRIERRTFLSVVGAGGAALLTRGLNAEQRTLARKPNVIIIVADDLGYADVGFNGCTDIPTPNLDSLAQNGVRFAEGYVTCPICSPSRAGLLTGRYQQRFGHEFNPSLETEAEAFGMPLDQITIAAMLKNAEYATGMVGKWHLGLKPEYHPLRRGFQEFYGFLQGAHSYVNLRKTDRYPILRGTEPIDEPEYLTDAFTREAVAFIDRHSTDPFFLYLTYNAVHTPMQAPQKYLDRFPNIAETKRRTYAAMLSAMDDGIGAVLRKLRDNGLDQDTMIFFFSDNGGPIYVNSSSNLPLNGAKGTVYEGGIRVPFLFQWQRRLPRGTVYKNPVSTLDIFATVAAAAGAEVPRDRKMDGVNLMPYLLGWKRTQPHEILFWRVGDMNAVRKGNWKLARKGNALVFLFDLATDMGEQKNLAKERPDILRELNAAFKAWDAELVPPLWFPAPPKPAPSAPAP